MTTATVAAPQGNQYGVLLAIFLVISFATVVVYWNHERRMDRQEDELYEHAEQLAGLDYRLAALCEYLGVDINEPVEDDSPNAHVPMSQSSGQAGDADTEEIPIAPPTVPDGMPLAVQTALIERHELMTPETAERQRIARAEFVEAALAKFDFSGRNR